MAITITPADVKAFCPTSLPDAVITSLIDLVIERMGACAEAAYPADTAKTILIYAVCHFVQVTDGGEVKSERSPNGSSTTFENHASGEGLKSTQSGRTLLMLDTAGCSNNLVQQTFLFLAAGDPATPHGQT
jgi:hypothetical protein